MLLIAGKKTSKRTKRIKWGRSVCPDCGSPYFKVILQRQYLHLYYIPLFPIGVKEVYTYCHQCGSSDTPEGLKDTYERSMKTPLYLYTGLGLFLSLLLFIVLMHIHYQGLKKEYVNRPQVNDVYLIREDSVDSSVYYFLQIGRISHDTMYMYRNQRSYPSFVNEPATGDEFITTTEIPFAHSELKEMLRTNQVIGVDRVE